MTTLAPSTGLFALSTTVTCTDPEVGKVTLTLPLSAPFMFPLVVTTRFSPPSSETVT